MFYSKTRDIIYINGEMNGPLFKSPFAFVSTYPLPFEIAIYSKTLAIEVTTVSNIPSIMLTTPSIVSLSSDFEIYI